MFSLLELVPRDILEYIAFLVVSTPKPVFRPPEGLLNLLLTSSTLYYSLRTSSAPHLYARIFRSTFDLNTSGTHADTNQLTDSGLTIDLISRYRLLRRVRCREFSGNMMLEDLFVAMRTVIESAGVNEVHLRSAGFSEFMFSYARRCLIKHQLVQTHKNPDPDTSLALWLLALTLSRDDISKIAQEIREHFLILLRPFVLGDIQGHAFMRTFQQRSELCVRNDHTPKANCDTFIPTATSAAIILYFAFHEAGAIKVSPRLLFGRAVDFGDGREGPTIEDYCRMTNYQTALFGDDCPAPGTANPRISSLIRHDPQFFNPKLPGSNAYRCLPDIITGLWEGVYMVSCTHTNKEASSSSSTPDFVCKKFLQCSLVLFFHFGTSDYDPLVQASLGDEANQWTATPKDFSTEVVSDLLSGFKPFEDTNLEDHLTVFGRKTPYEKYVSSISGKYQVSRDYSQALDCLVIGQTAQDHDRAWGGFNFAGRLKRDGTIVMKREPKNTSDACLGTWIFEGNVRYGSVLVGTWRSGATFDGGIHGLFSLGKKVNSSEDES